MPDRFPDPTHPGRTYVIDAIVVKECAVLDWTHEVAARWHAEENGVPVFGATYKGAFTHRWGTPEQQGRDVLLSVMLPLAKEPELLDGDDDEDRQEDDE